MGAWIEIPVSCKEIDGLTTSHPTMGAWIEMQLVKRLWMLYLVAPHDGCVDWNVTYLI